MKKLILASVAAVALTTGYANAGIILQNDENDRKVWINTWAGQTEDKGYAARYGSSASTYSGVEKNNHEVFIGRFQGGQGGNSASTFYRGPSSGVMSRSGKERNSHEVFISRFAR